MAIARLFVAILAIALSSKWVLAGNTKIHIPRSNATNFPRLRLDGTLPPLREFTFCAWIRPFDSPKNYSTIFSYATKEHHNELLILLFNEGNTITLHVYREEHQTVKCHHPWTLYTWQHVCVSWLGAEGVAKTYQDGLASCEDVIIGKGKPIVRSGGVAIIGQEQDEPDSKFDPSQSWYGDIASVQLWDEVLSMEQIRNVGRCKGKKGNLISWNETPMIFFDGVIASRTEHCS